MQHPHKQAHICIQYLFSVAVLLFVGYHLLKTSFVLESLHLLDLISFVSLLGRAFGHTAWCTKLHLRRRSPLAHRIHFDFDSRCNAHRPVLGALKNVVKTKRPLQSVSSAHDGQTTSPTCILQFRREFYVSLDEYRSESLLRSPPPPIWIPHC